MSQRKEEQRRKKINDLVKKKKTVLASQLYEKINKAIKNKVIYY